MTESGKAVSGGNLAGRRLSEHGVLTIQMEMFINYLFGEARLNTAKAAAMAGYKDPRAMAEKLMNRPSVQYEIEKRLALMSKEAKISPQEVQELLIEEAKNHTPKDSSAAARVSALKILAQTSGLLKEEGTKRAQVVVNIQLGDPNQTVTIDGEARDVG